jgi:hypothetical protein
MTETMTEPYGETFLADVRALGLKMGGLHQGRRFGWTTDAELAQSARELGASVMAGYNKTGPCGWEVSLPMFAPVTAPEAPDGQKPTTQPPSDPA